MKRSFFEIIAEILYATKDGAKKTHIIYNCNLSYHMSGNFINYLLATDLLKRGNSFHITEKGKHFLRTYRTLDLLLRTRN